MTAMQAPRVFLEVRLHDISRIPGLTGICAGYEGSAWRATQLAAHLIEWLPEFALTHSEIDSLGAHNLVRLLGRAAKTIYNTQTSAQSRVDKAGELGELLLHVAIRQVFQSLPAISKFYYKDSANNTVKGFDAVHVVDNNGAFELWLGEVKFYSEIGGAIRDVVKELENHTQRDYLRGEFACITNKIDSKWEHSEKLTQLIDPNTSLDKIFSCVTIPVFLSYESTTVAGHSEVNDAFNTALKTEIETHYSTFQGKSLPTNVRVHLFLFPLSGKKTLVDAFHERLQACQLLSN